MLKLICFIAAIVLIPSSRATDSIDLGEGKQPQVAISSSGEVLITFGRDNTIYFTKSADHGKTFDPPTKVAALKSTPLGMRRGPRIAATKDGLAIAAIAAEKGGGKDGDVFVFRSI